MSNGRNLSIIFCFFARESNRKRARGGCRALLGNRSLTSISVYFGRSRGNTMRSSLFVCGIILSSLPASAQVRQQAAPEPPAVKFPLQVSKDRRYLMGQDRLPFLIVGDTAWSLIADLKEADIKAYLDDRHKRGFNAIVVNLLEHKFATNAPRNRAGLEPFMKTGDFATPNTEYFDFAHRVVGWANERGISVWLAPAYLGWNGGDEGFFQEINAGGRAKLQAYGKFVGERFKDSANIVWLLGGDYAAPKQHQWAISDLAQGIKAAGAKQLMTVHGGQQSAVDVLGDQDWIDINTTYSYDKDLLRLYRKDYERKTVRPFVLIESTYENEHGSTPEQVRRQAYWAMTCGACGQFLGNNPIWHFDGPGLFKAPRGWRAELDGTGSRDIARLRTAFVNRPWHELVPDRKNTLVTKGIGEGTGTITAATTRDNGLAMIYIPSTGREARELSVDLGRFPRGVRASWFNPTDGGYRPAADGALANTRISALRTPGDNGTRTNDWLLIIESKK
jgi:hypothetical protein